MCFFHADAKRPIFTGKTLQYVEQSIVHWVQSAGALALVIPSPEGSTKRGDVTLHDYAALLDGLVLHGGSDVAPSSYGEEPLKPEWGGDVCAISMKRAAARVRPCWQAGAGRVPRLQVINVHLAARFVPGLTTQQPGGRSLAMRRSTIKFSRDQSCRALAWPVFTQA